MMLIVILLRGVTLAGHETTSTSLAWACHELSEHQDIQDKLRKEVLDRLQIKRLQGDVEWSWKDFEQMPYLTAFTKVIQYHDASLFW